VTRRRYQIVISVVRTGPAPAGTAATGCSPPNALHRLSAITVRNQNLPAIKPRGAKPVSANTLFYTALSWTATGKGNSNPDNTRTHPGRRGLGGHKPG